MRRMGKEIWLLVLFFLALINASPIPLRTDLGREKMEIYTKNPMAQQYFNQGFRYLLSFNFKLAYLNFEQAQVFDNECILCYWGRAFSLGQNLNAPMSSEAHAMALEALEKGTMKLEEIQDTVKSQKAIFERDKLLLLSLKSRYGNSREEYIAIGKKTLNLRYAENMEHLAILFPNDDPILYFTADSLMNTSPWNYYEDDGLTLIPETSRARDFLYKILEHNEVFPGAIHLLIHLTEASKHPEEALPYAKKLAPLIKGSSHLQHMPSHTFIRVGKYEESAEANHAAVFSTSDEVYPMHNMQFLLYSYRMMGQKPESYEIANQLYEKAQEEVKESGFTQQYVVEKILTLVMFEDWKAILAIPPPAPEYSYWKALWFFARAMALITEKDSQLTNTQREERETIFLDFVEAAKECVEDNGLRSLPIQQLMELYTLILEGRDLIMKGKESDAVERMEIGLEIESSIPYWEPPIFIQPFSHYLIPPLLLSGQNERAINVIQQSLENVPHDGWALMGLVRACHNLNNSTCEKEAKEELNNLHYWQHSEVTLDSNLGDNSPPVKWRVLAFFDFALFGVVCVVLGGILYWINNHHRHRYSYEGEGEERGGEEGGDEERGREEGEEEERGGEEGEKEE